MTLSLKAACTAFAAFQSGVIVSQARVRATRAAAAEPDHSQAIADAERALSRYAAASGRFAFVLGRFPAANDDTGPAQGRALTPRPAPAAPPATTPGCRVSTGGGSSAS